MLASLTLSVVAADSGYIVRDPITLGETGKWDYTDVDLSHHRLFVTRGTHVQVIDLNTRKIIGDIPSTDGVHGVAFAPELNLGFTSNGNVNSVTVFNLESLKVQQEIKISGAKPDAILYETNSHKLYVFNGKSNDVTVIDAKSLKVLTSIKASGRPEFAASDSAGKIFFNIEDKAEINVIDVASDKIIANWTLKGCEEPTGLALDIAHSRLFSACHNKIVTVTDAKTGKHISEFPIGVHPDAVVYDADTAKVFVSNGDSATLSIAQQNDADHYVILDNIATLKGAKTMAFDRQSKTVYLPTIVGKELGLIVVAPK